MNERNMGYLRPLSVDDLLRASEREHLNLSVAECEELAPFAADFVRAFDDVEDLPDVQVPIVYLRTPGHRPSLKEDPVNAFRADPRYPGRRRGPSYRSAYRSERQHCRRWGTDQEQLADAYLHAASGRGRR